MSNLYASAIDSLPSNSKLSLTWDPILSNTLGEIPRVPGPLFSWLGTSELSRPLDRPTDASFRRKSSCPMLNLSLPMSNGAPAAEELSPALSHGKRELLWEPDPISRFLPRLKALPVGNDPIEAWRACPGSLTTSVRYARICVNAIPLTISGAWYQTLFALGSPLGAVFVIAGRKGGGKPHQNH